MIISLYPLRYDKYTSRQQREKVIEEIRELEAVSYTHLDVYKRQRLRRGRGQRSQAAKR